MGLVGLALLVLLSTWTVRHARRKKLEREAETFEGPWPDSSGYGATGEKLSRSPSGRTARSNAGSDEALIGGGYGHQQQPSMQQYGALPPPPARAPPMGGYTYESPYAAAYQQPAYMPPTQQANVQRAPTNGSSGSGGTFGQYQPGPMPPVQQQQYPVPARSPDNASPPPANQGGPSAAVGAGTGSNLGSGAGAGGLTAGAEVRASTGSDAYADYAYATGPGQQGAGPRNLTVANA